MKKNKYLLQTQNTFFEKLMISLLEKTGLLKELGKVDISERQITIYKAIESSVKTTEMKSAVKLNRKATELSEYYRHFLTKIPKLTSLPFNCPAVKAYYTRQS